MAGRGDVLENPRRRERVVVLETSADTGGKRVSMSVTQEPTRARMPTHSHPRQRETFNVKAGALTYVLGRSLPRVARAGDVVTVEQGVAHSWWNEGPETVEMIGTLEPAGRWLEFMETIYGLVNDHKVNSRGLPNPLQMAVVAWEFRQDWVPTAIPAPIRLLLLPVLASVGRAVGYRPTYPRYGEHASTASTV